MHAILYSQKFIPQCFLSCVIDCIEAGVEGMADLLLQNISIMHGFGEIFVNYLIVFFPYLLSARLREAAVRRQLQVDKRSSSAPAGQLLTLGGGS